MCVCVCGGGGGGGGGSLEQVFTNKAAIWNIHYASYCYSDRKDCLFVRGIAAIGNILTLDAVIVEILFSCSTKLQSGTYIRY